MKRLLDRIESPSSYSKSFSTVISACDNDYLTSSLAFGGGGGPQQWKYSTIKVPHKKNRTECDIFLVAHAVKIQLEIIASRLSDYYELVGILPEEQSSFRPNRSTTDIMFVIHQLQELVRKKQIPLYACFIYLTKAYDSVNWTLLGKVFPRFGTPQKMISVMRQFHDGMQAYMCGSLTVSARAGSRWNRVSAKDACSRPSCSTYSSWWWYK